jgi:hypothetical protein
MEFQLDIDGETITVSGDELIVHDAQAEAPKAAAAIFYWGSVAAVLRSRLEGARSDYRALRGKSYVEALTAEPKLAEWKVTAAFEASENFRQAKAIIEHWQRMYDQSQAIYQAVLARSSTIQTIYNYESGGRSHASALGSEVNKEAKTEKVRKVMRKKQ